MSREENTDRMHVLQWTRLEYRYIRSRWAFKSRVLVYMFVVSEDISAWSDPFYSAPDALPYSLEYSLEISGTHGNWYVRSLCRSFIASPNVIGSNGRLVFRYRVYMNKIWQRHFTWQKLRFWNNPEKLNPLAFNTLVGHIFLDPVTCLLTVQLFLSYHLPLVHRRWGNLEPL